METAIRVRDGESCAEPSANLKPPAIRRPPGERACARFTAELKTTDCMGWTLVVGVSKSTHPRAPRWRVHYSEVAFRRTRSGESQQCLAGCSHRWLPACLRAALSRNIPDISTGLTWYEVFVTRRCRRDKRRAMWKRGSPHITRKGGCFFQDRRPWVRNNGRGVVPVRTNCCLLPCRVRVTNLRNGRSTIIRLNDRGPFIAGRTLDVTEPVARELGFYKVGLAPVRIEVLSVGDAQWRVKRSVIPRAVPVVAPPRQVPR